MNFIKNLFKPKVQKNLMDFAPYLTPWYLTENNPKLLKNGHELKWKQLNGKESAGIIVLENQIGESYMFLDMSSYILVAEDNRSFLVWSRKNKTQDIQKIDIYYYETENLTKFVNENEPIKSIRQEEIPIQVSANKQTKISIKLDPKINQLNFAFSDEFKKFGEFMILAEMENLYENLEGNKYWHNTVVIDLNATEGKISFFPQDWFNKSNADFDYQWLTRVIRNPKTNSIIGQGIRIDNFELDETNKELKRSNAS